MQKQPLTFDANEWEAFRQLGHRMPDEMLDYLQHNREQPAWQKPTEAIKQHFQQPLPLQGQSLKSVYEELLTNTGLLVARQSAGREHIHQQGFSLQASSWYSMLLVKHIVAFGTTCHQGGKCESSNQVI